LRTWEQIQPFLHEANANPYSQNCKRHAQKLEHSMTTPSLKGSGPIVRSYCETKGRPGEDISLGDMQKIQEIASLIGLLP